MAVLKRRRERSVGHHFRRESAASLAVTAPGLVMAAKAGRSLPLKRDQKETFEPKLKDSHYLSLDQKNSLDQKKDSIKDSAQN